MKKILYVGLIFGTISFLPLAHADESGHEVGNGGDLTPYLIYMGGNSTANGSVMISCPQKGEFMCKGTECINAIHAKNSDDRAIILDEICLTY